MFNKHSQGGNIGKPQDPHRLPQLTPHISKVCLPHGGEPRHIRISSNFPSACNDLIRLSSCESLSKKWTVTGIGQTSTINKLKILLEEKCYGKSHNLRLCVLESLKWTTCRWRIPRFWNRCSRAGFLLLSEQYGIFSNTLIGYTATPKLGSSDFYNDLPNLKGKSKKIGQRFSNISSNPLRSSPQTLLLWVFPTHFVSHPAL